MDVAQAHSTNGGGSAKHCGSHRSHVKGRAQIAASHQVILIAFRSSHAVPAQHQHAEGVDKNDGYIQYHDWSSRLICFCFCPTQRAVKHLDCVSGPVVGFQIRRG
ncbi:hypothetical protein D9M70_530130 [compost metagenome]